MNRRQFLKLLGGATAAAAVAPTTLAKALEDLADDKTLKLSTIAPGDGKFTLSCYVNRGKGWEQLSTTVKAQRGEEIILYSPATEGKIKDLFGLQLEADFSKPYLSTHGVESGHQNFIVNSAQYNRQ